jgi:hypothetical protein
MHTFPSLLRVQVMVTVQSMMMENNVAVGGLVVGVLATGPKVRGFKYV